MTDPLIFESNATKAESIAAKLAASELFGATIGSANGNTALGAPQQPQGAPETGAQQTSAPMAAPTAPAAQETSQRHIVPGVGATPPKLPEYAGKSPYEHLASLLG